MKALPLYLLLIIIGLNGCSQQSPKKLAIFDAATNNNLHSKTEKPDTRSSAIQVNIVARKQPQKIYRKLKPKKLSNQSIWGRMLSLYALDKIDNPRVQEQINFYLKHPAYLTKIQHRAAPYLHFILQEIEEKNLPGEFALLPVVESAFLPEATSRSQAAGIWQFIPSTGRYFGLKQNWWYDGRRDVYASTKAATRYLKELSEEFNGDWFLALASYNAGKGNIRKAIRKNVRVHRKTDYWSLRLSRETMNYVPRLLAIAHIFANAEKYNLELQPIPDKPHFAKVNIGSQIDLATAAKLANMTREEFNKLNPGFKRWLSDPDGPHYVLVPTKQKYKFYFKLSKLPASERVNIYHHKIKPGESLGIIARKYNTRIQAIKRLNKLSSYSIRAGKSLMIPVRADSINQATSPAKPNEHIYTVKQGDNFWRIARRFSVKSVDIARWNKLSLNSLLKPGQKLIIKPA